MQTNFFFKAKKKKKQNIYILPPPVKICNFIIFILNYLIYVQMYTLTQKKTTSNYGNYFNFYSNIDHHIHIYFPLHKFHVYLVYNI